MNTYHSHLNTIPEADCLNILKKASFGHLGFQKKDRMMILPINFLYKDKNIYSHSLEGSKLEAMREHPRVCLQTEVTESAIKWKSVIAWGQFEECSEQDANQMMRDLIKNMNLTHQKFGGSSLEIDFSALLERAVIYRIKIDEVVGRSEGYKD
ncbi:hypothetical protein AZI87_01575 [Bdellovibrio bacteriovorus]|uniref:Pyridoxamine 5'-phosphate oxidase putative domain-containing protein n=1 Tax=Bdellovibrio bacteriovorus TaxID=959 RepID=A0A162GEZ1_BDEBC|nr:pyridoxamine 5'-phosphate oxidase family protein [Bdellovibrio bacteriovorus]KYG67987.1 hypothetical protein AZI87_01575 [Bdellovibrio bacteriovorus]